MLATYIDEIIMVCVGAWAAATGFGYMRAPVKDPLAREQWENRYGKLLRWIGPIVLIIAIILALSKTTSVGGSA